MTGKFPGHRSGARAAGALYGAHPFGSMTHSDARRALHPLLMQWLEECAEAGGLLEVGCGGGDWLRTAVSLGVHQGGITGIDIASMALPALREEGYRVCAADAAHLPLPDDACSRVLCYGVLHHTPDPEAAFRELVRIALPGGTLCVATYHWGSPFHWLIHRLAAPVRWCYWHGHPGVIAPFFALYGVLLRKPGRWLLRQELDKATLRTLFMDQCITPYVHNISLRRITRMARAQGCEVLKTDYAGHRTMVAVVLRAPNGSIDSRA